MKKKYIYKLFLGIGLLLPLHVGALETTTSVTCTPNKISSGSTVTCTFKANVTSGKLAGFGAKYDLGEGVSYVADSFTEGDLPLLAANANGFNLMKASGSTGAITLGNARFTVTGNPGNYKIGLKDIDLSDDNATSSSEDPRSTTVRIQSSVNTLSSLSIEANGYSEDKITNVVMDSSNSNIVASAVVDADSIMINATPTDSAATVSGTGVQSVGYGTNEKKIKVKAEDGTEKVYTLILVRPDTRSNNNFLANLKIKGYDIDFNKGTLEYNITVGHNVDFLEITYTPEDENATVEIRNNNLKVGKNEVQIVVTAENESRKIYKINVQKDMVIAIPNTAAGKSILVTIISLIMIGSGYGIVTYTKNRKANS